MGSPEKPLNPEAKPWQPSKSTHQRHFDYYYYPFIHTPISGYMASTEAGPVSRYNVRDQPGNPNHRAAGKIHEWSTPTDNGGCDGRKEVVWSVSHRKTCGVKEKACINRSFRLQRKSKSGSTEKMSDSGGQLGPNMPTAVGDSTGGRERTTVMIKNIPNQFRRDMLLSFLDEYCIKFELEYDFVYLPMDFKSMDNLGYAFVNFTSSYAATKIQQVLTNYKWGLIRAGKGCVQSNKTCQVTWARLQGKIELVKNFVNSNFICYTYDYLPVILDPPSNGSNSSSITLTPIGKCRRLPMLAPKLANTLSR